MFKKCPLCHYHWQKREDFLADRDLEIIGYQVCFDEAKEGLFLFNHLCKTTLALKVHMFEDLYVGGARYEINAAGTDACSGFCVNMAELSTCKVHCKYAYVRHIIECIRKWPKS